MNTSSRPPSPAPGSSLTTKEIMTSPNPTFLDTSDPESSHPPSPFLDLTFAVNELAIEKFVETPAPIHHAKSMIDLRTPIDGYPNPYDEHFYKSMKPSKSNHDLTTPDPFNEFQFPHVEDVPSVLRPSNPRFSHSKHGRPMGISSRSLDLGLDTGDELFQNESYGKTFDSGRDITANPVTIVRNKISQARAVSSHIAAPALARHTYHESLDLNKPTSPHVMISQIRQDAIERMPADELLQKEDYDKALGAGHDTSAKGALRRKRAVSPNSITRPRHTYHESLDLKQSRSPNVTASQLTPDPEIERVYHYRDSSHPTPWSAPTGRIASQTRTELQSDKLPEVMAADLPREPRRFAGGKKIPWKFWTSKDNTQKPTA